MTIKIWHQCGHNSVWNYDSHSQDHTGGGLILSPVHQDTNRIENLGDNIKENSLFDPQFYLPTSQKRKLQSYDFFPDVIADGFSTDEFSVVALDSGRRCVKFQMEQGFSSIVIPARYFDEMVTNFIEQQKSYTVTPFLKAIDELQVEKDVLLSLPITSAMIKDQKFRIDLLNWITGYPEIHGVYLLISHHERGSKQISDAVFLEQYLSFVKSLCDTDLRVITGYQNTESLLFSLVESCELTVGTFENTRMFSLDKFIESDEEKRGPKSRIYIPGLFQWIQWNHAIDIRNDLPKIWDEIYIPTTYGESALNQPREPHFNQPDLYKHHLIVMDQQIKELGELSLEERYQTLRKQIRKAMKLNQEIEAANIDLDRYGRGEHLQGWLDAINAYYRHNLQS